MLAGYIGEDVTSLPGHVIATFLQLDHSLTIVTTLPAGLFSCFEKLFGLLVFWAILRAMPPATAKTANFCFTSTAFPKFLAIFLVYVSRLDPFAASTGRAIYSIFGRIFCKFGIPILLKLVVK